MYAIWRKSVYTWKLFTITNLHLTASIPFFTTGAHSECWRCWGEQGQVPHRLPPTPQGPRWVVEALPLSLSRSRSACVEQQCLQWKWLEEHWQDAPEPERGGSAESGTVWSWLPVSSSPDRLAWLCEELSLFSLLRKLIVSRSLWMAVWMWNYHTFSGQLYFQLWHWNKQHNTALICTAHCWPNLAEGTRLHIIAFS